MAPVPDPDEAAKLAAAKAIVDKIEADLALQRNGGRPPAGAAVPAAAPAAAPAPVDPADVVPPDPVPAVVPAGGVLAAAGETEAQRLSRFADMLDQRSIDSALGPLKPVYGTKYVPTGRRVYTRESSMGMAYTGILSYINLGNVGLYSNNSGMSNAMRTVSGNLPEMRKVIGVKGYVHSHQPFPSQAGMSPSEVLGYFLKLNMDIVRDPIFGDEGRFPDFINSALNAQARAAGPLADKGDMNEATRIANDTQRELQLLQGLEKQYMDGLDAIKRRSEDKVRELGRPLNPEERVAFLKEQDAMALGIIKAIIERTKAPKANNRKLAEPHQLAHQTGFYLHNLNGNGINLEYGPNPKVPAFHGTSGELERYVKDREDIIDSVRNGGEDLTQAFAISPGLVYQPGTLRMVDGKIPHTPNKAEREGQIRRELIDDLQAQRDRIAKAGAATPNARQLDAAIYAAQMDIYKDNFYGNDPAVLRLTNLIGAQRIPGTTLPDYVEHVAAIEAGHDLRGEPVLGKEKILTVELAQEILATVNYEVNIMVPGAPPAAPRPRGTRR